MVGKNHVFGIFGAMLLIVAFFAPIAQLSDGKTIGLLGLPWLMLVATIIWSGIVIVSGQLQRLLWPALLATVGAFFAGYQIYKAQAIIAMMRRAHDSQIDPSLGLFQWGWLPLILGIFCLFLAALSAMREYN